MTGADRRKMGLAPASMIGAFAMFCAPACAADAVVTLPTIDQQDIRFTTLSINGERFKETVYSIAQDKHGFIWLGTSGGLARYDGYSLKRYRHDPDDPDSLSDDTVRSVLVDRRGNVWAGTNFGGLDRLEEARDVFIHYRHDPADVRSLSANSVSLIYEDRSGALWLASNGLNRLDPGSSVFIHYRHDPRDPNSLSSDQINSIYQDRKGNLWVGTFHGLNKLDQATSHVTRYEHNPRDPHSLGPGLVSFVWEDHEGTLWVGAGNLLDALDPGSGKFTHYSFLAEQPSAEAAAGFITFLEARGGTLWMGTVSGGLLRFEPDKRRFIRYKSDPRDATRLSDNDVWSLFQDSEGIIWAGTKAGVSRFTEKPRGFVRYQRERDQPNGLRDNVVWSAHEDSRGYLWIGTRDGLQRLDRKTGQFTAYLHDPRNPSSIAYDTTAAVREDRSGMLWVGTYGGGLNRLDPATGRFFAFRHEANNPNSLSHDRVLTLLIDRQDVLWVGTGGGGLNRFDARTGHFRVYRNRPGDPHSLSEDDVKVITEDRQGMLWLGTNSGLNRFDPATQQFTVYRHTDDPGSLSNDAVNAIHEDHAADLWIGTRKGIQRMDRTKGTFAGFTIKDGLPDDAVESILEDGHGDLWLGTHGGLSHFNPRNRTFRNYTESDGLAGDDLNPFGAEGSCVTRDGEFVFGSKDGLTVFHPDKLSSNPYTPPVVLTEFLLSNKAVRAGSGSPLPKPIWAVDDLTLNHSQNIFEIEFASLSYADPVKNRYRYRLEGLGTEWYEADSQHRSATYTNLPARTYTFRVQGSNNDGVWNTKGVTLTVTVLPPWWETWWFRTVLILTAAALAFAAYRARIRQLNLRFEDRFAERTRIAQELHDTLIQDMVAVGLQLDIIEDQIREEPDAVPATLNVAQNRVGEAVSRGRHTLTDLRSSSASTKDLIESLSRTGMELRRGDAPRFQAFVQGDELQLHSLIWHELDRIGHEAITNAFRHARAKSIEVGLYGSDQTIQLVVRDDGCGMPTSLISAGRSGHFGLRGMRERAERAGGRLSVRSRRGGGTEVSVTVPLRGPGGTKGLFTRIASLRPFDRSIRSVTRR